MHCILIHYEINHILIYIIYYNILIYNTYDILKCGYKGTSPICDFRYLLSHHNSICDVGLNISKKCLKFFLDPFDNI